MGSVKIDVNSGESFYKDLSLSDFDTVKLLIQFRDKYDQYFGMVRDNYFDHAGDVKSLNKEMINVFVYLDKLINDCRFSKDQMFIVNSIQVGYTYQEIADSIGIKNGDNVKRRFNKICKDIVKMNDWLWRKCTYINDLGLKTKRCSKCKEDLPATDEFFSPHNKNNDGFFNYCKQCRAKVT